MFKRAIPVCNAAYVYKRRFRTNQLSKNSPNGYAILATSVYLMCTVNKQDRQVALLPRHFYSFQSGHIIV